MTFECMHCHKKVGKSTQCCGERSGAKDLEQATQNLSDAGQETFLDEEHMDTF